ncbi:hypothetical protein NL676_009873 [Syzygium grande]|nr:hypothetical protein NL676_009873 [Syzygium grande]
MFLLLQCSPDLSQIDCQSCFLECIDDYQDCCHGRQCGIAQKPSCIFRWELYLFFDPDFSIPPPTPTAVAKADPAAPALLNARVTNGWFNFEVTADFKLMNHNSHSKSAPPMWDRVFSYAHEIACPCNISKSLRIVVAVVGSAILFVMVIVSACCFIRRRRHNPWKFTSDWWIYRASFENGQDIAVKRLEGFSNQGMEKLDKGNTFSPYRSDVKWQFKKRNVKMHPHCIVMCSREHCMTAYHGFSGFNAPEPEHNPPNADMACILDRCQWQRSVDFMCSWLITDINKRSFHDGSTS